MIRVMVLLLFVSLLLSVPFASAQDAGGAVPLPPPPIADGGE